MAQERVSLHDLVRSLSMLEQSTTLGASPMQSSEIPSAGSTGWSLHQMQGQWASAAPYDLLLASGSSDQNELMVPSKHLVYEPSQLLALNGLGDPALGPGNDLNHDQALQNSASLYVKNLPQETTELFLYQKFSPHGALSSCKVYTDPTTGKCRGVGFVNFVDREAALKAMQQLHGFRFREGHQMHITLQAPRAVRNARQQARAQLQSQASPSHQLLVQLGANSASVGPVTPRALLHTPSNPAQAQQAMLVTGSGNASGLLFLPTASTNGYTGDLETSLACRTSLYAAGLNQQT